MGTQIRGSCPKVGKRRIQQFERDTGITLPADYRDFLLRHNGGHPAHSRFEIPELREEALVDYFHAIDGSDGIDLEDGLKEWKDEMPAGFLPIANDPGGAIILMGTKGKHAGRVYFWDHQHFYLPSSPEHNTYLLATSFSKFIDSLKPDEGPGRWDADVPKLTDLIQQSLEHAGGIQPAQMARLATEFAKLPKPHEVVAEILRQLFDHESSDVRRVAAGACRRIAAFDAPGLQKGIVKKLSDPDEWVRYDAVWMIREAGYDGADVRKALSRLAKGITLPKDEKTAENQSSNGELRARVEARKALDTLLAKP